MTMKSRDDFETLTAEEAQIGLIVDYLQGNLSDDRVAEVRRRLDDDPVFKDLAAPLIAAWSVPPRWQRKPIPHEIIVREWERFAKRAAADDRRRKRRPWFIMLGFVLVLLLTGGGNAWWQRTSNPTVAEQRMIWRMHVVPDTNGRITLADGTRFQMAKGAVLLVDVSVEKGKVRWVHLEGEATVSVAPRDTSTYFGDAPPDYLFIHTRGGIVMAHKAVFHIVARGRITDVHVDSAYADCARTAYGVDCSGIMKTTVSLIRLGARVTSTEGAELSLLQGQTGEIRRGEKPFYIPARWFGKGGTQW